LLYRMPDWLAELRGELMEITAQSALRFWPGGSNPEAPCFNYRLEHVMQVERDALRLLSEVGGDEVVVLAGVWLHDRFQPQFEGEDHVEKAAQWAADNLEKKGFPAKKVAAVSQAVAYLARPRGSIPAEAREARLLWDADKLARVGAVSIVGRLCSITAFPDVQESFASITQKGLESLQRKESLVEGFYFDISGRWALERFIAYREFYQALSEEVGIG
jgi:hypothetical protein